MLTCFDVNQIDFGDTSQMFRQLNEIAFSRRRERDVMSFSIHFSVFAYLNCSCSVLVPISSVHARLSKTWHFTTSDEKSKNLDSIHIK